MSFKRPMTLWWRRDPFFVRYMWREATALGVLAYAVVLMIGVLRLAQGPAAWNGWLEALRSPLSIAFHAVLLVGMVHHAVTWFEVMPKTMPMLFRRGVRVPDATLIRAGLLAGVASNLALLAWVGASVWATGP